jgi:CheY-like chemotaxis protein
MADILIVDDSQLIRNLLTEYLDEKGFTTDTAFDGEQGIQKALTGKYRLVICDIHMPRRNGYEVFTTVRRQFPNLNFIMTDSLPDHLAEQAQNEGAIGCLQKPFDLDELIKIVEKLLTPNPVR